MYYKISFDLFFVRQALTALPKTFKHLILTNAAW